MKRPVYVIGCHYLPNTTLYYASNHNWVFDAQEARIFSTEAQAERHLDRLQGIDADVIAEEDIMAEDLAVKAVVADVTECLTIWVNLCG